MTQPTHLVQSPIHKYHTFNYHHFSQFEQDLHSLPINNSPEIHIDSQQQYIVQLTTQNQVQAQEIDRLQQFALTKTQEAEHWKLKFEQQASQLLQVKGAYESQIQGLSNEIFKVNSRINEINQLDNSRDQGGLRFTNENTTFIQVDTLKQSLVNQAECYEAQLRKMRDLLQDKQLFSEDLQTKYEKLKCDYEDLNTKLLKEIEILRNRLSSFEIDRQNEINSLKTKFEFFNSTNTDNMRNQFISSLHVLQEENQNLKGLLEIKNQEIETLLLQNQKQKIAYDDQLELLRKEIYELKHRIVNNENVFNEEYNDQNINLTHLHNNDLIKLNDNYRHQVFALENEVNRLKDLVDNKNREIETQFIEKQQIKLFYDEELIRLTNLLEESRLKFEQLDRERYKQLEDAQVRLEREQFNYNEDISKLNLQLHHLVEHKNKEIESNLINYQTIRNGYEEEARNLKNEIELVRNKLNEIDRLRTQEIDDLKLCLHNQEIHYREKFKQIDNVINHQVNEIRNLKDAIIIKSQENENIIINKNQLQAINNRLKDDNQKLIETITNYDQVKAQELLNMFQNLDQASLYQFDNLKSAYNTQVAVLNDQIKTLQQGQAILENSALQPKLSAVGSNGKRVSFQIRPY